MWQELVTVWFGAEMSHPTSCSILSCFVGETSAASTSVWEMETLIPDVWLEEHEKVRSRLKCRERSCRSETYQPWIFNIKCNKIMNRRRTILSLTFKYSYWVITIKIRKTYKKSLKVIDICVAWPLYMTQPFGRRHVGICRNWEWMGGTAGNRQTGKTETVVISLQVTNPPL